MTISSFPNQCVTFLSSIVLPAQNIVCAWLSRTVYYSVQKFILPQHHWLFVLELCYCSIKPRPEKKEEAKSCMSQTVLRYNVIFKTLFKGKLKENVNEVQYKNSIYKILDTVLEWRFIAEHIVTPNSWKIDHKYIHWIDEPPTLLTTACFTMPP